MLIPTGQHFKYLKKDPFLYLGFGVVSYFKILVQLILLMIFLSIVTMPVTFLYAWGQDLTGRDANFLGRLGQA